MKRNVFSYFSLFLALFLMVGCASNQLTTRHLKKDELLLKKNKLKIVGNTVLDEEELLGYIRQKPNRAILFGTWRLPLQWRNLGYDDNTGIDKKRNAFLYASSWQLPFLWGDPWEEPKKDGADKNAPVILDTTLIERSERQLKIYLQNQGYYNAVISHTIRQTKILGINGLETKKAVVEYIVSPGKAITIDSTSYNIEQPQIAAYYKAYLKNRVFNEGEVLRLDRLQEERERIVTDLQNRGYYDFAENYISFDVDTNFNGKKNVLITKIKQPVKNDSIHRRYSINNIYIQTDFDPYSSTNVISDSTLYNEVHFLSKGTQEFKPDPIYRSLFFHEGEFYNQKRQSQTYRQIANLGMFSYIKIDHKKIVDSLGRKMLDVHILLGPAPKMTISTEVMGIFREGFGVNGQILFTNKNAFKGSEILSFSISGGFEDLRTQENPYTTNIGPRLSLTLPRLLFLNKITNSIRKNAFPKTTISTYFNYQQRTLYTRYLTNAFIKYEWNEGNYKKHELSVFDANFAFITKDSKVLSTFNDLTPTQRFKFEDAISSGLKYSFTYNNQNNPKIKNSDYLIVKGSLVGPAALVASALGWESRNDTTNALQLGGVRYATFFKAQADYRKYFNFRYKQQIAVRGFLGFGVPLDKDGVIPFDQLYYSGGANSIRGWQQRTLGPGSDRSTEQSVDNLGEIKLEANIEYRFPITSILKGAVFIDAGNIWTEEADLDADDYDPNFAIDRFYKEIAVSPGLGVRFDFDFFLFRLDLGLPIKQAYHRTTWKFDYQDKNFYQLNFGVGYPF